MPSYISLINYGQQWRPNLPIPDGTISAIDRLVLLGFAARVVLVTAPVLATWPSLLPQSPLLEGHNEEWGDVAIHSEQDEGPHKSRARFTRGIDTLDWSMLLSISQLNIFETFYKTEILGGAIPYRVTHPRKNTLINVKIIEKPKPQTDNQYFRLTLKLLVMPQP